MASVPEARVRYSARRSTHICFRPPPSRRRHDSPTLPAYARDHVAAPGLGDDGLRREILDCCFLFYLHLVLPSALRSDQGTLPDGRDLPKVSRGGNTPHLPWAGFPEFAVTGTWNTLAPCCPLTASLPCPGRGSPRPPPCAPIR